MTQKSYFWGGTSVGDATLAPYDDDEFSDFIMNALQYNRDIQGVVFGKGNNLVVTNPSGLTIQIDTGIAFVDGKLYNNDVAESLTLASAPVSGTDYYHVTLRKSFSAQTVRLALVGPVNGGPATPAVHIDGTTWEILLAEVTQTSGGTITIYDRRQPLHGFSVFKHFQFVAGESIQITNLPAYAKGIIIYYWLNMAGAVLKLQFNGDTSTNYNYAYKQINFSAGTEVVANAAAATAFELVNPSTTPFSVSGKVEIINAPDIENFALDNVNVMWQGNTNAHSVYGGGIHDINPITQIDFITDSTEESYGISNVTVYVIL